MILILKVKIEKIVTFKERDCMVYEGFRDLKNSQITLNICKNMTPWHK